MSKKIVYIAGCIPTLTCTFIQREIFDLHDLKFEIQSVSMNSPASGTVSRAARPLLDSMIFLDNVSEFKKLQSFVVAFFRNPRAIAVCLKLFFSARPMQSARDYLRLGYHLIEACYLADELRRSKPDHIHCHFIHSPTSLGMFLSKLLGVPFSFTMHASLIWTDPIAFQTKLTECAFCVSISQFNKDHVLSKFGTEFADKIHVIHCGVEFPPANLSDSNSGPDKTFSVLGIGQLKRRKGFHVLVQAAKILKDRGIAVAWTIVGDGDQRNRLESMIREFNLEKDVKLAGAQLHENIPGFLADADVFALPCVIGDDDTRDGIPVALMEAMSRQLPVVSTNIVGLPELIDSGKEGILVDPDNPEALADAIADLSRSPELRERLGTAAAEKIDREFNSKRSARQLAELFDSGCVSL